MSGSRATIGSACGEPNLPVIFVSGYATAYQNRTRTLFFGYKHKLQYNTFRKPKKSKQLKIQYKHPFIFYLLATIIPWTFWLIAGKLSQETNPNMAPMVVALWLVHKETGLKRDLGSRLFHFANIKPIYLILTASYRSSFIFTPNTL